MGRNHHIRTALAVTAGFMITSGVAEARERKLPVRPNAPAIKAAPAERGCPLDTIDATAAINEGTLAGTTLGGADATNATCGAAASPEVIYAIRPTQPGPIQITTAHAGTDYDTVLSVRTDCDDAGDEIACNDDFFGLQSQVEFQAEACVTYYVVVEGYAQSAGAFELSIGQAATGPVERCRPTDVVPAQRAVPAVPATPAVPGGPGGPAVPPTFPVCAHSTCVPGEALEATCSPCAGQVCALDPYCCDVAWDGICVNEAAELCGGECAPVCGDGWCGAGEGCDTCAADCGSCPECGNGLCEWNEWCDNCSADCGECPPPPVCGDGICDPWSEWCEVCPDDCGACPPPPVCGDGICDPWSEWCEVCPGDCGACPGPVCGDAICEPGEGGFCFEDCGVLDCAGIYFCAGGCADDACVNACLQAASPEAATLALDLSACAWEAEAAGVPVEEACAELIGLCFN